MSYFSVLRTFHNKLAKMATYILTMRCMRKLYCFNSSQNTERKKGSKNNRHAVLQINLGINCSPLRSEWVIILNSLLIILLSSSPLPSVKSNSVQVTQMDWVKIGVRSIPSTRSNETQERLFVHSFSFQGGRAWGRGTGLLPAFKPWLRFCPSFPIKYQQENWNLKVPPVCQCCLGDLAEILGFFVGGKWLYSYY